MTTRSPALQSASDRESAIVSFAQFHWSREEAASRLFDENEIFVAAANHSAFRNPRRRHQSIRIAEAAVHLRTQSPTRVIQFRRYLDRASLAVHGVGDSRHAPLNVWSGYAINSRSAVPPSLQNRI